MAVENKSESLLKEIKKNHFKEVDGFGGVFVLEWPSDLKSAPSPGNVLPASRSREEATSIEEKSRQFIEKLRQILQSGTCFRLKTMVLINYPLSPITPELIQILRENGVTPITPNHELAQIWSENNVEKINEILLKYKDTVRLDAALGPDKAFITFFKKTAGVDLLIEACKKHNVKEAEILLCLGINPNGENYRPRTNNVPTTPMDKFILGARVPTFPFDAFLHLFFMEDPRIEHRANLDQSISRYDSTPGKKLTATFKTYLEIYKRTPTQEGIAITLERIIHLKRTWTFILKMERLEAKICREADMEVKKMALDFAEAQKEVQLLLSPPPPVAPPAATSMFGAHATTSPAPAEETRRPDVAPPPSYAGIPGPSRRDRHEDLPLASPPASGSKR